MRPAVVMGRVLGAYGVRGWLKVQPFTDEPAALAGYPEWLLGVDGEWRETRVAETARHGAQLVARLEGCTSREQAARLRGCEIAVPRERLPQTREDEFYRADLVGARVINRTGQDLGRIEEILDNGAHAVMRLRGGEPGAKEIERLVPFVPNVVERVDLGAGEVRVDWGADW